MKSSDEDDKPRVCAGKGFAIRDEQLRARIKELMRPSTAASLRAFAGDWLAIIAAVTVSKATIALWGIAPLSLLVYAAVVVFIGSRMRALENLTHEGLHRNLSPDAWLNDLLAWTLAAMPLFHNIGMERLAHFLHHGFFWKEGKDPDLARYHAIGIDKLPAKSRTEAVLILTRGFVPYVATMLPAFFVPRGEPGRVRLVRLGVWLGAVTFFAILGLLPDVLLYWIVPFLTSLTIIRFFAEVSEHVALGCSTEFATTRNNLSWLDQHLLHPHGDGYHLVHHLFPKIPHHNLGRAHHLLMEDPIYRSAGRHCHGVLVAKDGGRSTFGDFSKAVSPAS